MHPPAVRAVPGLCSCTDQDAKPPTILDAGLASPGAMRKPSGHVLTKSDRYCTSTNAAHKSLRQVPISKMAALLSRWGYTQICVARGIVALGSEDEAAIELELWYSESTDKYCIFISKAAGVGQAVCKVINVFTLHFQKCSDKIKTFFTKKSKFHFVQY